MDKDVHFILIQQPHIDEAPALRQSGRGGLIEIRGSRYCKGNTDEDVLSEAISEERTAKDVGTAKEPSQAEQI